MISAFDTMAATWAVRPESTTCLTRRTPRAPDTLRQRKRNPTRRSIEMPLADSDEALRSFRKRTMILVVKAYRTLEV